MWGVNQYCASFCATGETEVILWTAAGAEIIYETLHSLISKDRFGHFQVQLYSLKG